jgi:penicillin-binding protein 1B
MTHPNQRWDRAWQSLIAILLLLLVSGDAGANELEDELGRNDVRVFSSAVPAPIGWTVLESSLLDRLERRGYRRVHSKPTAAGEYFFGESIFWIYRKGYRIGDRKRNAQLFGLDIDNGGVIRGVAGSDRKPVKPDRARLEPVLLSESLEGDRAPRIAVDIQRLPEHVWRAVLAAEDHRFFDHHGLDGKAIARALLRNLKKGEVAQGGSTITQQLIKNRDLSPKRSLGRKASEAVRALAMESEYSKEEILQAYLNSVYLGHINGIAVYGFGAAAKAYFSVAAEDLDLAQAAALAALIQGPNRRHPERHPDRLVERRNWVIGRMSELEWVDESVAEVAIREPLGARLTPPGRPGARTFVKWAGELARSAAPRRLDKGRGVVVETSLDPTLQRAAEAAIRDGLDRLRRTHRINRTAPLQAALVAIDVHTGDVLAYVSADPSRSDVFDRVRSARRQPGSAVKPLLLLEAFSDCGGRQPLHPATRVADTPLTLELPDGEWSPRNPDGDFRGVVDIRQAVSQSLNIPFVRVADHCGMTATALRLRRAGMALPTDPPPSFVLGSVVTTPLELVTSYSAIATPGAAVQPRPVLRIEAPGGRNLRRYGVRRTRVTGGPAAFLVHDLLQQAAASGTARGVGVPGLEAAAKTGTSSGGRDAWLAGDAGGVVAVVWVGRDDDQPMGLSGAAAAAPIWRDFMEVAARARPARTTPRPDGIVSAFVDPDTGLRVRASKKGAQEYLFRKGAMPRKNRPILRDRPETIIE